MHATDIVAYTYRADIYCPVCMVRSAIDTLNDGEPCGWGQLDPEHCLTELASKLGIDREDERSFDSDDFPKVVFGSQIEENERCGRCGEVI